MSAQPLFKRIRQIGLVVRDAQETAKRCWEDFGMGPWTFYKSDPSNTPDMMVHGRRVDHAMLVGHANFDGIDWEIIEPLDENSIYAEHLRTRGEGVHHILFHVEDYFAAKSHLGSKGYEEIGAGKWRGRPYSYFDTERSLGCFTEIWSPPPAGTPRPTPVSTYPKSE